MRQEEYTDKWLRLDVGTKGKIKQDVLMTLASPNPKAGHVAAQVVSAIAAIDLPANQWPELVELMLSFVNNSDNTNLRISTLQAIGFICDNIVRTLPLYSKETVSILSFCSDPKFSVFALMRS